jgi:uncharacterized protein (TIGR00255 family)
MANTMSMTGFGTAEKQSELGVFSVEIKSVNHRFLEPRVYLPRDFSALELPLTRIVKDRLGRGKVDASVRWTPSPERQPKARFNSEMVRQYDASVREMASLLERDEKVSLEFLLQLPGVMETSSTDEDATPLAELAASALGAALDALIEDRRREGAVLEQEILSRLDNLATLASEVEARREVVTEAYREKLRKKAEEWAQSASIQIDPGRLEAEVLMFAERSDITEELVRLRTHVEAFRALFAASGPQGKPMEFLTQELLRESNTIASKSRDTAIGSAVLTMKNEIEKIREQILNVE